MPSFASGNACCTACAITCAVECLITARPSGESAVTGSTSSPSASAQARSRSCAVDPGDDHVPVAGEQVAGGSPRRHLALTPLSLAVEHLDLDLGHDLLPSVDAGRGVSALMLPVPRSAPRTNIRPEPGGQRRGGGAGGVGQAIHRAAGQPLRQRGQRRRHCASRPRCP